MMGVATDLSKDELHMLEVAWDLLRDGQGGSDDLREWAIKTYQSYLAAGRNEGEIVDRIPGLIDVLTQHLHYTKKSFELEVAGFPKTAAEREEDLAGARAAQGLIERMRETRG